MQELNPDYKVDKDPVPEITRRHFEIAMMNCRRSISQVDLDRFENFRKKFDP
jgi:transitional endoplasmic reticulum ATPase